jgi:hypothetical protein
VTITGVPVEIWFGVVATLVGLIYADIKRDLNRLNKESIKRSISLARIGVVMRQVSKKLDIPYPSEEDENE